MVTGAIGSSEPGVRRASATGNPAFPVTSRSPGGDVLVADGDNQHIQQFTRHGGFVQPWGAHRFDDGAYLEPFGFTADFEGDVNVADAR
jgi:hypothetical protein